LQQLNVYEAATEQQRAQLKPLFGNLDVRLMNLPSASHRRPSTSPVRRGRWCSSKAPMRLTKAARALTPNVTPAEEQRALTARFKAAHATRSPVPR
jgi:hypothetical protein